ncbi:apolipoprotein N-acyltransferase [Methylobacter sp. S3L5C]|uniref:apolipoprotein N-acyltransferase n=1 Tax=Methylobacter sp. S3L5C TaxID=2839024 RepID=UPI001FAD3295|nr:apolipoprotein N-acyltransferase [Methylobacter sp. S3L5C]UOA09577.1 apolipoprotein N-acyltransferase [Methylobacter sp. S3L5C]
MQISSKNYWDLLPAIAGIFFTLAFSPFNYAYLAPLALGLLFTSWQNVTPKRALLRGYLFGLGSFGLGVSWVYISIHDFGGADSLSAGLLTCLFCSFWALFPALAGYLSVKILPVNKGLVSVIVMPVIWLLVEYLRGCLVLNGFPWLQIAYSQLATPLAGYIPIVGVYGTGFLTALTAAALVAMLQSKKHRLLLTAVLAALWITGSVLQTIKWTDAIGEPIRVSLIQGNITQDKKWRPENKLGTLQYYKTMTEVHWDSDVIVWPETSIPAYLSEVNEWFLLPLSKAARQHHTDLIVSLPAHGDSTAEKYNAVMTLGKETGMYRKKHLLPFGEYLPWQPVSGFILNSLGIKLGNFTPGSIDQPLLKAGGYAFITSICYEDAFGDAGLINLAAAAYLVNVTNDGWFGDSIEPHQHLQIARMRAMETGRFMLRSTNTGVTAIIAPNGKIISQAPVFKEAVLTDWITPMHGMTPYARLGDQPVIIALIILLFCLIVYLRLLSNKPLSTNR